MLDELAAPTVSSRVPSEFIGQARVFRSSVKLVDVAMDKALDLICAPLRARLRRHPKLRAEMLPDVARQYDQLIPQQFRIGKIEGAKHKAEFAIVERRLCVSWMKCDEWTDPEQHEPGVTICKFTFSVKDGRLRQRWTPQANFSLHALARRIERGRQRDHASLLHDVALLADAGDTGERVETPCGFWLGKMIDANGEDGRNLRIRSVRTWIDGQ